VSLCVVVVLVKEVVVNVKTCRDLVWILIEWIWLFVEVDCDDEKWTVCPDDGRWNPGVLHALIVVFMTVVEEPVFDGIWKVVEPKVA